MATIVSRRGTAIQWATANPILNAGELGLETDTGKMKFGDGTSRWTSLSYTPPTDTQTATLLGEAIDLLESLSMIERNAYEFAILESKRKEYYDILSVEGGRGGKYGFEIR